MYRPAATVIANTLAGLPFSIVRITVYNIIIYFMTGLHRSAGAFFTFELLVRPLNNLRSLLFGLIRTQVLLGFLTMQGFFRTFGLMFSSFHTAFRVSVFFVPNLIVYVGYMIPVFQMKRWLFWIVSIS